jgi:hypothetical protein
MALTASQEVDRFVQFYADTAKAAGWAPDETTSRDQRVQFLSETLKKYCSKVLVMKRASPTRPVSDEVVVSVLPGGEYRLFRDFIVSGGSSAWRYAFTGPLEQLPTDQPLVSPLDLSTLSEPVAAAPTVPGCTGPVPTPGPGPGPGPTPTPPANTVPFHPYDGDAKWVPVSQQMEADYKEANGVGLDGGCGMWIARTIHDCYMGENAQTPPLTLEVSLKKHRAELRAALGLPPL